VINTDSANLNISRHRSRISSATACHQTKVNSEIREEIEKWREREREILVGEERRER